MIEALVASTVALVAPFLGKAAEEAAKTVGKDGAEAGIRLLGWLRDKMTGRAREALEDAEKNPSDDNLADLRKQLGKLLVEDRDQAEELRALLPASTPGATGTNQTVGAGGRASQIVGGSGNTVSIS